MKTALSATEQRTLALAKASNRATLNNLSRLARVGHTTFCADAKVGGCGCAKSGSATANVQRREQTNNRTAFLF